MTDIEIHFSGDRLQSTVESVLAAVVAVAAQLDVALPTRQIAGVGVIPYDCEMVFATATQITTGAPEANSARSGGNSYPNPDANNTIYKAAINLGIVRKTTEIPSGAHGQNPPAPTTFLANLSSASTDVGVLINAIDKLQADQGVAAIPRTVTVGSPQGAVFAVTATISLIV